MLACMVMYADLVICYVHMIHPSERHACCNLQVVNSTVHCMSNVLFVVESNSLEPATRKMLLTLEYTGLRFGNTDPYSVDPAAAESTLRSAETEDEDGEAEASALPQTEPGYCCLTSAEIKFPSEVDKANANECGLQSTDYEEVRPRTGFSPAPNPREKDEIRIHNQVADEAVYADVKIESNYLHFGEDIIASERDDCEIGLSDDDYSSLKIPSSYLQTRYD